MIKRKYTRKIISIPKKKKNDIEISDCIDLKINEIDTDSINEKCDVENINTVLSEIIDSEPITINEINTGSNHDIKNTILSEPITINENIINVIEIQDNHKKDFNDYFEKIYDKVIENNKDSKSNDIESNDIENNNVKESNDSKSNDSTSFNDRLKSFMADRNKSDNPQYYIKPLHVEPEKDVALSLRTAVVNNSKSIKKSKRGL